jgi:hypothetical protein
MDEIELLVEETYKHFEARETNQHDSLRFEGTEENEESEELPETALLPEEAGLIYHVQKTNSVFVIRTFVSHNIREDFAKIIARPEDYPSLRLVEGESDIHTKLKFFMVEELAHAEIIHDQLHNRRFPVNEEMMCNLSDPGFSWWLTKKTDGFQISFNLSVSADSENTIKLGPLGDRELAIRYFQVLASLVASAGIEMNIQNEMNRVQFSDCEEFILEELKDIFEFGVVTETLKDLFKILSHANSEHSQLQETWFYLHELAAMRRFWIQISFDLNVEPSLN